MTGRPAWTPAGDGEYRCRLHRMRVADCPCPPVEEWPVSPYAPAPKRPRGRPPLGDAKARRLTVYLPPAVLDAIAAQARAEGVAPGALAARVLAAAMHA